MNFREFWRAYSLNKGAVAGLLFMAVVLFLPDGLVSLFRRAKRMRLVQQLLGRVRDDVVPQQAEKQTEEAAR